MASPVLSPPISTKPAMDGRFVSTWSNPAVRCYPSILILRLRETCHFLPSYEYTSHIRTRQSCI